MPAWLIGFVVNLVVKFGLPYVLTWLHSKFPWIPISDDFLQVLKDLIGKLAQHNADKKATVIAAKEQLRDCIGPTCAVNGGN